MADDPDRREGQGPGTPVAPGETESSQTDTVAIRIPADPEYVPILRAACSQLAPRLGCTLAETADLRLAVDEACGLLLRNCIRISRMSDDDGLRAVFVVDGGVLHLTLTMVADAFATPDDDEFGWTILAALVDDFSWRAVGSTVRVQIRKTHAAGR